MITAINTGLGQETLAQANAQMKQSQTESFAKKLAAASKEQATGTSKQVDAKLMATCKDMEAVFLNLMLTRMRATVPKNNLLGDQSQIETMQSLLDTEMTKNLSQAGGVGLAQMLYKQLSQANAVTPKKG